MKKMASRKGTVVAAEELAALAKKSGCRFDERECGKV
jgi:hypothetical protein